MESLRSLYQAVDARNQEEIAIKIGFDLDGVLCDIDLRALDHKELRRNNDLLIEYFRKRKPQLNPLHFTSIWDEVFTITSRPVIAHDITRQWHSHYFPQVKLIFASIEPRNENESFLEFAINMAKEKAKIINELQIDVYIEDTLQVVQQLRELCPQTKIIHFTGGNP